jgi:hypothetical protein
VLKPRDVIALFLAGSVAGLIWGLLTPMGRNPEISAPLSMALWPVVGGLAWATGFIVGTQSRLRRGRLVAGAAAGGFVFGMLAHMLMASRHSVAGDALIWMISAAIAGVVVELLAGPRREPQ